MTLFHPRLLHVGDAVSVYIHYSPVCLGEFPFSLSVGALKVLTPRPVQAALCVHNDLKWNKCGTVPI